MNPYSNCMRTICLKVRLWSRFNSACFPKSALMVLQRPSSQSQPCVWTAPRHNSQGGLRHEHVSAEESVHLCLDDDDDDDDDDDELPQVLKIQSNMWLTGRMDICRRHHLPAAVAPTTHQRSRQACKPSTPKGFRACCARTKQMRPAQHKHGCTCVHQ